MTCFAVHSLHARPPPKALHRQVRRPRVQPDRGRRAQSVREPRCSAILPEQNPHRTPLRCGRLASCRPEKQGSGVREKRRPPLKGAVTLRVTNGKPVSV
ncbi:hypothetical protein GN956_G23804 [Arapaima gigas]